MCWHALSRAAPNNINSTRCCRGTGRRNEKRRTPAPDSLGGRSPGETLQSSVSKTAAPVLVIMTKADHKPVRETMWAHRDAYKETARLHRECAGPTARNCAHKFSTYPTGSKAD